jgi:hypothetical protein
MKMRNMLHSGGVIMHASPLYWCLTGLQMMFGSWLSVKMTTALSPPTADDLPCHGT